MCLRAEEHANIVSWASIRRLNLVVGGFAGAEYLGITDTIHKFHALFDTGRGGSLFTSRVIYFSPFAIF